MHHMLSMHGGLELLFSEVQHRHRRRICRWHRSRLCAASDVVTDDISGSDFLSILLLHVRQLTACVITTVIGIHGDRGKEWPM